MNDLNKIHPMYQFSLKETCLLTSHAFSVVFQKAVLKAEPDKALKQRVSNLIDSITSSVFQYTTRGLFECDKLTSIAQLAFQLLLRPVLDFRLRYPVQPDATAPVDFPSKHSWGGIKALCCMEEFRHLDRDIEGSAKCWKKFEWKNKTSHQRLCMMRALRPDRMTYAEEKLGSKYMIDRSLDFAISFEDLGPATPLLFILSPGVDPLKDVERHGNTLAYTNNRNHWVILQNIHLVARWLGTLEKRLEQHVEGSRENFRMFVRAEPSSTPEGHIIPQGILENSIKITSEPPTGMHANLHKALDNFNQGTLEMCARENEFKSIWFALCYFHAVVAERMKFGPQGWNRSYPFNTGDLTISINVLYNYLEANPKVPFDDLRYLFGEIMFGGHIKDDLDPRLCQTYLEEYIKPEMMEGELYLAPGFPLPGNMNYNSYHQYSDDTLPPELPYLYGLHPNAEIGVLTLTSEKLFCTLLEMQPRDGGLCEGNGTALGEKVRAVLEDIMEKLPEEFSKAELRTKYLNTIRSVQTCTMARGALTVTSDMENLQNAIFLDMVPDSWTKQAYPSMSGQTLWFTDLLTRIKELETWSAYFVLPSTVWLAGLFNPQSFLTAIMQAMTRRWGLNEWPLDRLCLQCDITKKNHEEFIVPPREGACTQYTGYTWRTGMIMDARLKDLNPTMPNRNVYQCPVFKTHQRGPTYMWTFNLKTKENPTKWTLAGVALLLQI
uniref:Uncharacterized protein n=1 Tax=Mola mola TaxID=94237 RepID=A0A3Q3X8H1_MOLML